VFRKFVSASGIGGLIVILLGLILASLGALTPTVARYVALAGLLLVALYLVQAIGKLRAYSTSRAARHGSNLIASGIILLAILVLVNLLSVRHHLRYDVTSSKRFTLADQTIKILRNLDREVKVIGFFKREAPEARKAKDLLREYEEGSEKLKVEFVDPDERPSLAKEYEIARYGTIVVASGSKVERIFDVNEEAFTNAILKASREESKVIYFLVGHGERDIEDSGRTGFSKVKAALQRENYAVRKLTLFLEEKVPSDCAVLVIAGPEKRLFPEETRMIDEYLKGGGKLFCMLDPRPKTGMRDLLRKWRVRVGSDRVIDKSIARRLFNVDDSTPVVVDYAEHHKITENFRVPTLFPQARSIELAARTPGFSGASLVRSSSQSWAETGGATGKAEFNKEKDRRGPISVAVAVWKEAGRQSKKDGGGTGRQERRKQTRLVVFGDSDFANDTYLSFGGNKDLFLNCVNWLAEEEELISIRPKGEENRPVHLTERTSRAVFYITLLAIPILVLGSGIGVWWSRRGAAE